MQQVQHAKQIYEFMPSPLPNHVFESTLPAQWQTLGDCTKKSNVYKTKA